MPHQPESSSQVRSPFGPRAATLLVVLIPPAGLLLAIVLIWGIAFNWTYLALLVGGYIFTALGITIGYHRLFTHKSFDAPAGVVAFWGILGSMGMQGPITRWAATHRMHHQHSDAEDDPHSPHLSGEGLWGFIRGAWRAHVGWLFERAPDNLDRYVPDLIADPVIRWIDRFHAAWVVLGLVIPTAIAGILTNSWTGAALGLLWGGLVRVFVLHHVTWSINSVCHLWGSRPFDSHDESRNNPIFGILAFGEGWHNNHHAFPASARHGLQWWQFDASYLIIRAMERVGLARRVRVPSPERMERRRRAQAGVQDAAPSEQEGVFASHGSSV